MSSTNEPIHTLNFDSVQTFESNQKPLFVNNIDLSNGLSLPSSVSTTTHITPLTQHSITASVPHQTQLTTTIHMSPNSIEKSKQALQVN
jgi:hypothetical protein